MSVLATTKTWRKTLRESARMKGLDEVERANVRRALRFLRTRLGGAAKLAEALGVKRSLIDAACAVSGKPPNAGLAIRAARLAGVSVEGVLSGEFPTQTACPHCGRT